MARAGPRRARGPRRPPAAKAPWKSQGPRGRPLPPAFQTVSKVPGSHPPPGCRKVKVSLQQPTKESGRARSPRRREEKPLVGGGSTGQRTGPCSPLLPRVGGEFRPRSLSSWAAASTGVRLEATRPPAARARTAHPGVTCTAASAGDSSAAPAAPPPWVPPGRPCGVGGRERRVGSSGE